MIKLNTEQTSRDNDTDAPSTSSGVMLTTILLLIGSLLLTSAMLIHYGFGGTDENGKAISGLTRAWELTKSKPAPPVNPEPAASIAATTPPANASVPATQQDAVAESSGFSLKDIFSKNSNGSVRWPRLKLAGFGRPSEGEVGFAIINGKHVVEGSTINGVALVEILAHGVIVEYKGETKTLIVEMTH